MPLRNGLIAPLTVLHEDNVRKGERFKARAYKKALESMAAAPAGSLKTLDDLAALPGWGQKLVAKADEWIRTGHIGAADAVNADDDVASSIALFTGVAGVGPVKARELAETHGLRSIEALRARGPELLNAKQLIGLRYYEDFLQRIPRKEMDAHVALVTGVLQKTPYAFEVVGSYRRGAASSGDIDVLVCAPHLPSPLAQIISGLQQYLCDTLAQGDKKYMGVCRLKRYKTHRRFDMLITPPEEYPFALLYFTGSGEFNVEMRQHAIARGYSLSEHGLKGEEPIPPLRTERDIFDFLGLAWVEPCDRKAGAVRAL
jgi:DNA polymerase beta